MFQREDNPFQEIIKPNKILENPNQLNSNLKIITEPSEINQKKSQSTIENRNKSSFKKFRILLKQLKKNHKIKKKSLKKPKTANHNQLNNQNTNKSLRIQHLNHNKQKFNNINKKIKLKILL